MVAIVDGEPLKWCEGEMEKDWKQWRTCSNTYFSILQSVEKLWC